MKKRFGLHGSSFFQYPLLLCGALLLLSSCFAPRYRLNEQERALIANQRGVENISIRYDRKAIRRLDSNGIYTVECYRRKVPSIPTQREAMVKAIGLARRLVSIMNFKEHHRYIYVVLTGADNSGSLYGNPREYSCIIGTPVADVRQAFIVEKMKWGVRPTPEPIGVR